jgi:hypothetical protein
MWIGAKLLAAAGVSVILGASGARHAPNEPAAAEAPKEQLKQPREDRRTGVTEQPLQTRDVTERLKTIRSEIVLEQELTALRKAQLERLEIEAQISSVQGKLAGRDIKPASQVPIPRMGSRRDNDSDFAVKAVTTKPFKEAIVTYKGRTYTVRPGDKLGTGLEIRDITETGVITSGADGNVAQRMLMGQ